MDLFKCLTQIFAFRFHFYLFFINCRNRTTISDTKTRVVFGGSAKTSTGVSLSDTFMNGPTIQDDLFLIVTRFRSHPVALTADIEQMYRQIRVFENDRFYQKILWRSSPNDPIKTYSLNTVTFGTACYTLFSGTNFT